MKIWDAFGELILEIMKKDHNKCSILRWKHPCAGFVTIIIKLRLNYFLSKLQALVSQAIEDLRFGFYILFIF